MRLDYIVIIECRLCSLLGDLCDWRQIPPRPEDQTSNKLNRPRWHESSTCGRMPVFPLPISQFRTFWVYCVEVRMRCTLLQIYHCRNVKSLYIATLGPWLDSRLYLSQANTIPRSIQDHIMSSNEDRVMEEWLIWLLLPVEGIDLSSCGSMPSYQRPLEE